MKKSFNYLAILSVVFAMFFMASCSTTANQKAKSGQELFSEYMQKTQSLQDNMGTSLRGGAAESADGDDEGAAAAKEALVGGMSAYNSRNYAQAITAFETALAQNANLQQARFYLGASYLSVDNLDKAQDQFKVLLQNENSYFYDQSQWYAALVHLNKNELKESKVLLEAIIANKDHYCRDLANNLIGQVEWMLENGY